MKAVFHLFILAIIISGVIFAHGKEKHENKDTLKATRSDTLSKVEQRYEIKIGEQIFEHVHNKIVHFPIAFVVAGFILTLLGFKWNEFSKAVNLLVFLAGLFAISAYLTGVSQELAFENTSKEWVVETHESLGIATMISIWVWFLFLNVKNLKKFAWLVGVIALILVLITGFYGGILAHG